MNAERIEELKSLKDSGLEAMIETLYKHDKHLTEERFGNLRHWIKNKMLEYAKFLEMDARELFLISENMRSYWSPNYYQEAKFPKLDGITILDTHADFRAIVGQYQGRFICPACKHITTNPQECNSGYESVERTVGGRGKVCDWKSYGLLGCLGQGYTFLIKEAIPDIGVQPMTIFQPAPEGYAPPEDPKELVILKAWNIFWDEEHGGERMGKPVWAPTRSAAAYRTFLNASLDWDYYLPSLFKPRRNRDLDKIMTLENFKREFPKAKPIPFKPDSKAVGV